jgi:hypothetical protein
MTRSYITNISSERVIQWMNLIRDLTNNNDQYRLLENFWKDQLRSKSWLVNELIKHTRVESPNIFIFGGWYGVLAQLVSDTYKTANITSVDIDPNCKEYGTRLALPTDNILFLTGDMRYFQYNSPPDIVINTSTEHITQETFDKWRHDIPSNTITVLQGNNFYSCHDHIRCAESLDEFNIHNPLTKILYSGTLECYGYERFMTIGIA